MSVASRLHFRRCHVCGEVNCIEGKEVKFCIHCHKLMAPFFFFQQSPDEGYSDSTGKTNKTDSVGESTDSTRNTDNSDSAGSEDCKESCKDIELKDNKKFYYQPLRGLTVIW